MTKYILPPEPTAGRAVLPTEPPAPGHTAYPTQSVYPSKPSTAPSVPYRDIEEYKNQAEDTLTYWTYQAFIKEWARYEKSGWHPP